MQVTITPERPDTPDAIALVDELDAAMSPLYPPASHHGYDVGTLITRGVAFFVARVAGQAAGCGGVQLFGAEYGELKRMYVRPAFRGHGLASRILSALEAHARARGVPLLRLETGIHQHEAIRLYERHGFRPIGPFGAYEPDPVSLFMEKPLG